jgi:hypothetical protein
LRAVAAAGVVADEAGATAARAFLSAMVWGVREQECGWGCRCRLVCARKGLRSGWAGVQPTAFLRRAGQRYD